MLSFCCFYTRDLGAPLIGLGDCFFPPKGEVKPQGRAKHMGNSWLKPLEKLFLEGRQDVWVPPSWNSRLGQFQGGGGEEMSGGANLLPKFMQISVFRRASRFGCVAGHLALQ